MITPVDIHLIGRAVHYTPDGIEILPAIVLAINGRGYADLIVFTKGPAVVMQQWGISEDPGGTTANTWRWPPERG